MPETKLIQELWYLREELAVYHKLLFNQGLVVWSSGNISARDRKSGLVVIKPSGVLYPDLKSASMVVVDLDGHVHGNFLKPSTDCESHLYVYKHFENIHAVVHTHSTFATAFAGRGIEIPVVLTATADEFGGPIPCGDFARIGGDEIGREIVNLLRRRFCRAILLKHHGVFTFGKTVEEAVKAAVMVEDIAKTTYYALKLSSSYRLTQLLPDEEIEIAHQRYTQDYGQEKG